MAQFTMKVAKSPVGALAALALMAGAAQAQVARVETADLDLSKPSQAAVLNARIEQAADRYCSDMAAQELSHQRACREAFKAEAMDQLKTLHRQEEARSTRPANGAG